MTEEKLHRYYGIQYTQSVGAMAKLANVSVRTMKDSLKLSAMGYDEKIDEGWTANALPTQARNASAGQRQGWAIWMKLCARSSDCVVCCLTSALIPMGKLSDLGSSLKGVSDYDSALMAGLIIMEPLGTVKARNFAKFMAEAGTLEILGIEYPKMQLLTVAEILDGKRFKTPTVQGRHELEPRMPGIPAVGV